VNWTVVWVSDAEAELAELWLAPLQRQLVANAANEIDRILGIAPRDAGESREEGRRILLVPPLGVTFRVLEADRVVRVLEVWRFKMNG
jgi:hypothetical protein